MILLLLMSVVLSHTTGLTGDFKNFISVDLAMEDIKALPEDSPVASDGPATGEADGPAEEAIPEPEKKQEEPPAPPAKPEEAIKPPAETEGPPTLEAYLQFIAIHKQLYRQKAKTKAGNIISEALKFNTRHFYGGKAIATLKFGPDGKVNEALVDATSPELKAFFEEVVWDSMPNPSAFFRGFTGVRIEFIVLEGRYELIIDPL